MFATHQYLDAVDAGRKRFRDDEDLTIASAAAAGCGHHRNKRFQASLPLRQPPRGGPRPSSSLSQTIVPLNASPAEVGPQHTRVAWEVANNNAAGTDVDMDMMDEAQPPPLGGHGQCECADVSVSAGRMPTPMEPSFAAQPGGQQHDGYAPAPAVMPPPNGIVNLGHQVTGFAQDEYVPRAVDDHAEWHALQNHHTHHRRLPSPISEAGSSGTSNMNDDPCTSSGVADSHESCVDAQARFAAEFACSATCQSSPMQAMEHPNAMMDAAAAQHAELPSAHHHLLPASPPPSARRGHQRSKHTVNTWTWQPGMKKSFSIGYRTDCEKCRLKVPGHFNHIVIS